MRWVGAAALVATACGAAPPEAMPGVPPTPTRTEIPTSKRTPFVRVVPPAMEIPKPAPDLSEEPRWPLSIMDHPNLAPHHDVAGVLAEPGITWTELCARGVHERRDPSHRDELQYLSAWCAAGHHDVRTAVSTLAPLLHSVVPEIASAVPFDLANILVESQDADHAEQLLSDEGLRDPHLWDVLAASYFEVGKDADALQATSTAFQLAPSALPAATCHRLAREILLGSTALRDLLRPQLEALANAKAPDPECVELSVTVSCTIDRLHGCRRYYDQENVDPALSRLWALHETWDQARDWSAWIDMAWSAHRLASVDPRAIDMTLQALDAALVTSNCETKPLQDIWRAADAMAIGQRAGSLEYRANLAYTFTGHPADCAAFRERWLAANPQ
jgi:hypothetical protein